MNCPHCEQIIDDVEIARYLAAKGGSKGGKLSKRKISPEAQFKMQEGSKKQKE